MAIVNNINEYVLNSIVKLDSNEISVDDLVRELCFKLQSDYNIPDTNQLRETITNFLYAYQNKAISADEFVSLFGEIISNGLKEQQSNISTHQVNQSSRISSSSNNSISDIIVDVNVDTVINTSEQLSRVEDQISSANIDVSGIAGAYGNTISGIIEGAKISINEELEKAKAAMIEVLKEVQNADEEVEAITIEDDFSTISEKANNIKNSQIQEATVDFFKRCGCKIDGNIVTLPGTNYKYDLSTKTLHIGDGSSIKVTIYIPSGATEYDKLNTYTYFTTTIGDGNNVPYNNRIESEASQNRPFMANSILLKINKEDVSSGKGDRAVFTRANEVTEATKFINAVAKTRLNSNQCRNIIAGDSRFGAEAMKLAANNGDLYKTVYCINNAVIVNGYNVTGSNKTQMTLEEVQNLAGKDIYFISASGDGNLNHNNGSGGGWESCQPSNSYTITGLDYLGQNCPDAKVHIVYNEAAGANTSKIISEFNRISESYSNCTYEPELWDDFARGNYTSHSEGNKLVTDVLEAAATNYNYYS